MKTCSSILLPRALAANIKSHFSTKKKLLLLVNAALCTVLTKPEASICSQHQTNLSCSCQIRALVNTWHKTLSKKCYSSISLLFPVNSVPQAVSMNPPRHPSPESSCRSMQESSAKPQEKDQLPSTFRMVCTIHPTSVDVFRSI